MVNDKTNVAERPSVVVISQEENRLKAVELNQRGRFFEVLWTKSTEPGNTDWRAFAAECGLSIVTKKKAKSKDGRMNVAGLWSTGVAFYRIEAPVVGREETDALVRMQAETLMPLPAEQMKLAWRRGRVQDGQAAVTIAAARTERLKEFAEQVRVFEPSKILLDCEGIVTAWKGIFSGSEEDAVVVSVTPHRSQVCHVQNGKLSNAVVLDIGLEDFLEKSQDIHKELSGQTAVAERFSQDMGSILESLGYKEPAEVPVIILSDGDAAIESMVSSLKSSGMNARTALPTDRSFRLQNELGIEHLYQYRMPVGLGLMALETPSDGLDLFTGIYDAAGTKEEGPKLFSLKAAGIVSAVLLAIFAVVSYGLDLAEYKRLSRVASGEDYIGLVQRQTLMKSIARERPDLLQLLRDINSDEVKGVKLDSFYFKKSQLVSMSGEVQNNEQLYGFDKYLKSQKGLADVNIQNTSVDTRTKKTKFTIQFNYKTFTKKAVRTLG